MANPERPLDAAHARQWEQHKALHERPGRYAGSDHVPGPAVDVTPAQAVGLAKAAVAAAQSRLRRAEADIDAVQQVRELAQRHAQYHTATHDALQGLTRRAREDADRAQFDLNLARDALVATEQQLRQS